MVSHLHAHPRGARRCALVLVVLLVSALPCCAQFLEAYGGDAASLCVGIPYVLTPVSAEELSISPPSVYTVGTPASFLLSGVPLTAYRATFFTSGEEHCGRTTTTGLAPLGLLVAGETTPRDPRVPQWITTDSLGRAWLSLGATLTIPPDWESGQSEVTIGCVLASTNGDTLGIALTGIMVHFIRGIHYAGDGVVEGLSSGTAYAVRWNAGNAATVSPSLTAHESALLAGIWTQAIGNETVAATWVLPTSLRSPGGAEIAVSFPHDGLIVRETGTRLDPNAESEYDLGGHCMLTYVFEMDLTVPEGTPAGDYDGEIAGSLRYIGNAKTLPARLPSEYPIGIRVTVTDAPVPVRATLAQNYPNPFNGPTTIRYFLAHDEHTLLEVFDLLGARVATLVDGVGTRGWHSVQWSADTRPSGIYLYRLTTPSATTSRKLLLAR